MMELYRNESTRTIYIKLCKKKSGWFNLRKACIIELFEQAVFIRESHEPRYG